MEKELTAEEVRPFELLALLSAVIEQAGGKIVISKSSFLTSAGKAVRAYLDDNGDTVVMRPWDADR